MHVNIYSRQTGCTAGRRDAVRLDALNIQAQSNCTLRYLTNMGYYVIVAHFILNGRGMFYKRSRGILRTTTGVMWLTN